MLSARIGSLAYKQFDEACNARTAAAVELLLALVEARKKPVRIVFRDFFDSGRIKACGSKACQRTQICRREGIIGAEDKPVDTDKVRKKSQWLRSVHDRVINHLLG